MRLRSRLAEYCVDFGKPEFLFQDCDEEVNADSSLGDLDDGGDRPPQVVAEGEGSIYRTSRLSLETAIDVLERHFGTPIDTWENVTRTGRLDVGRVDQDSYVDRDEEFFRDSLHLGARRLPADLDWE